MFGNKAESHVRNFYVNQRSRLNLDEVVRSYEQEHGGGGSAGEGEEQSAVEEGVEEAANIEATADEEDKVQCGLVNFSQNHYK